LCLEAAKEVGYEDIVEEFQRMQDSHQYWVECALEQLITVPKVATRFEEMS